MNMYGSSEVKNVDGGKAIMPVDIQKIKLKDVTFKPASKDGSGDKVLSIEFEHENGAIESLKLWKINDSQVSNFAGQPANYDTTFVIGGKEWKFKKGEVPSEQALKAKEYFDFDVKIKHILSKFTEDTDLSGAGSYEGLAKLVHTKLKPFIGTEIEGLFEYDKKGYVKLYAKIPFLQKPGENTLQSKSRSKARLVKETVTPTEESDIPSSTSSSNDEWPEEA